jgi:hypothetical protein
MAPDRYRSRGIAPSRPVLAEFSGKKLSPRFRGVAANGVAKLMRDRQRQQFLPRRAESANQLARANRVRIEKGFIDKLGARLSTGRQFLDAVERLIRR